jgi:hypothetical protein
MRESLSLYGNELVEFTTFFSIGYAIGLVPGQLIQTKVTEHRDVSIGTWLRVAHRSGLLYSSHAVK